MNKIETKKLEIENYKRILDNYRGRWYDAGKCHLDSLYEELKALENEVEGLDMGNRVR